MYYLIQIKPNISCLGTSFRSIAHARQEAYALNLDYGLCEIFSVGTNIDGCYKEVYRSQPKPEGWGGEEHLMVERPELPTCECKERAVSWIYPYVDCSTGDLIHGRAAEELHDRLRPIVTEEGVSLSEDSFRYHLRALPEPICKRCDGLVPVGWSTAPP